MYIGVSLVDNKKIKALNKKHLGREYATDVLSFNYLDDGVGGRGVGHKAVEKNPQTSKFLESSRDLTSDEYLGDVVVSTEKAREQAPKNGNTFEQEVAELVAHGVLHLLGVHHKGDDNKNKYKKPQNYK